MSRSQVLVMTRASLVLFAAAAFFTGTSGCGGSDRAAAGSSQAASTSSSASRRSTPLIHDKDRDFDGNPKAHYDADDYKILSYGHEATPVERLAVTSLVKRYYVVAARADGPKACALMSHPLTEAIVGIYGPTRDPTAPHSGKCAPIASHLFKLRRRQLKIDLATLVIKDVRLGHPLGYAILSFEGLPDRHMLLYEESGKWKIDEALDARLV
jgi:hypothetical protein